MSEQERPECLDAQVTPPGDTEGMAQKITEAEEALHVTKLCQQVNDLTAENVCLRIQLEAANAKWEKLVGFLRSIKLLVN